MLNFVHMFHLGKNSSRYSFKEISPVAGLDLFPWRGSAAAPEMHYPVTDPVVWETEGNGRREETLPRTVLRLSQGDVQNNFFLF